MGINNFTKRIALLLNLSEKGVNNTLTLLNEGCTIPFIARYRKEGTGGLNEVQIGQIADLNDKLKDIAKRKETIIKTINDQGKLTAELQERIENCWEATELEDIYLPFRPKRRTRAQIAREQGLEPLATLLLMQRDSNPLQTATRFIKGDVEDIDTALKGAQDIIAEMISEDEYSRNQVRMAFHRFAIISSKVVKTKKDSEVAAKYSDYFNWQEPLKRCSSHRLLAMRRGENEGVLRVKIATDDNRCIERLQCHYVHGYGKCQQLVSDAVEDSYRRLIEPSIENEMATLSKEKADNEAIGVFAGNLRQLLLSAPLGQKRVMGIDPGFRTGCKVVCLDEMGNLLHHEAIFPHPPINHRMQAVMHVQKMVEDYQIAAIAIGNGTASRETTNFVNDLEFNHKVQTFVVSEDGASVYSASKTAREEFPDEDVTVRGAVSIGRRLMDPLAELVKIDPKSIGVGQYQHDVNQTKLKKSLDQTVENCVNAVGVNVNTASEHLLRYVSGLGPSLAKNIVEYRKEHGAFTQREQLKKVPRLGPTAFQQCAGFLRIPHADNPLDNSAVHPESYPIVKQMAHDYDCTIEALIADKKLRESININRYITADVGLPTLTDIMSELEKPGRDPREQLEEFQFDPNIKEIDDIEVGMILPGIITNITNFGAFVDIGVHHDGLVHVSQLANKFVKDPNEVVHLHQHVEVKVSDVDYRRKRISLTMKFKK